MSITMWAIVIGGGIAAFCIWAFLDGAVKRRHNEQVKKDIEDQLRQEGEAFIRDNPQNFPPHVPNAVTRQALDAAVGGQITRVRSIDEITQVQEVPPPRPHYTMEGPITSLRDGKQRYMIYEHSFQGGKQLLKTFMHQDRAQAYLNLLQGN